MIKVLQKKETKKHYQYVSNLSDLDKITDADVNIVVQKRKLTKSLNDYTQKLTRSGFDSFRATLHVNDFDKMFDAHFIPQENTVDSEYQYLKHDIKELLTRFSKICNNPKLTVFFGLIDTDMCRRFHADVNELRMLCAYQGPGTLWLTEDNINFTALNQGGGNEDIVLKNNKIKQLDTGNVAVIKGAIYPYTNIGGLVHRSPAIEYLNQKRIVLRVDSNSLLDSLTK